MSNLAQSAADSVLRPDGAEGVSARDVHGQNEIQWQATANTDSHSIIRFGFWSVGVGMLVFLLWAAFFPLASAVITPGTFVSDGKNKLVQHSSGGRVREIFVTEGTAVMRGDAILRLDDAQGRAELTRLEARHASLNALKARLDAERSGGLRGLDLSAARALEKPVLQKNFLRGVGTQGNLQPLRSGNQSRSAEFSFSLRDGDGRQVVPPIARLDRLVTNATVAKESEIDRDELIESQKDAYLSGRTVLKQEVEGLNQKIATLQRQKDGVNGRAQAQRALLVMARREVERMTPLARQGFIARNRLEEKLRAVLELEGTVSALDLDVLAIDTQIGEVLIQIRKVKSENSNVASREYTKIVSELAEISDQLNAARSAVKGSIVRAPESGTLTQLSVTTVGGVIGAGDLIGEIVPSNTPLIVQARVAPGDIDYVQIDQVADIAVTAFNRRIDDMLTGTVVYKSADAEKDEKTGDSFFTVRLKLTGVKGTGRSRLGDIQAGMQSEIYIHTGDRTFLTYLAKPMIDSFRRAFREQ